MRTLTFENSQAILKTVTKPGYFVYIGFTPPLRFSTRGSLSWNGHTWGGDHNCTIKSVSDSKGSISFTNIDNLMSSIILNEGVVDKVIKIWAYDEDAVATPDPVLIFDGVGDSAELTENTATISLSVKNAKTLYFPRRFINAETGFTHLTPAGTIITVRSRKITLSGRRRK